MLGLPLRVWGGSCSRISCKSTMAPMDEVMTTRLMLGCLSADCRIPVVPLTAGATNSASKSSCLSSDGQSVVIQVSFLASKVDSYRLGITRYG